jgi:hypothetical protein
MMALQAQYTNNTKYNVSERERIEVGREGGTQRLAHLATILYSRTHHILFDAKLLPRDPTDKRTSRVVYMCNQWNNPHLT